MAAYHTPTQTSSRRVLGDLTPKALNTPQSQTKKYEASEVARAHSPLKQVTPHTPAATVDKENLATPNANSQGKKRGIEEVDGVETIENAKILAHARDETLPNTGMRLTTDAIQRHTENNPIGLADPGSPTERATPSPSPEPVQEPIQASQKSNQSFSDFLNYEMCASQKSEHDKPLERLATSVSVHTPAPAPASSPTLAPARAAGGGKTKSRAEQLRTRLKFGLYKVKTNQVTRRDADIIAPYEASSLYSSDALHASRSTAMTSSGESLSTHRVPNITISSPAREQAPVFVKANLDPFRPISKLGPAPVQFAMPQGNMPTSSRTVQQYHISSSPPGVDLPNSVTPDQLMSSDRQRNHYQMPHDSSIQPGQYRTDEADMRGESARERLQRLKQQQYIGDIASNSIGVKGDAAEGLLQLMQTSR
ncbi:hypothetical protein DDE82_007676 [Stemphylium lycopersici]|nr:hypothetical protein TW65_01692 [Stemphylium lycopersici]RAR00010.1 hypothetical protein DDE82_007676 [Stemphylium lycopersici]